MASLLLDLCRRHGLKAPGDYHWTPFGPVVTEAGQRKLEAMAAQDPALLRQLYDASGEAVEAVLAGDPRLTRRQRRMMERALRG